MSEDRHYTPVQVALRLVAEVRRRKVTRVADFALGGGDLLRAALNRWPHARFVGVDVDRIALSWLRREQPTWICCAADFTDHASTLRELSRANASGPYDVILLNPPFSSRHKKTVDISDDNGQKLKCGKAISFVLLSLHFAKIGTEILAILPAGSRNSERDYQAWRILEHSCEVSFLFRLRNSTFSDCAASAEVYRFRVTVPEILTPKPQSRRTQRLRPDVYLVRGKTPIHKTAASGSVRIIHTTNIICNEIRPPFRYSDLCHESSEPAITILLPRVGTPSRGKICIAPIRPAELSDCVLGISSQRFSNLARIYSTIIENWDEFSQLYTGTGARFVSVLRLGEFLSRFGYRWATTCRQIRQERVALAQPADDPNENESNSSGFRDAQKQGARRGDVSTIDSPLSDPNAAARSTPLPRRGRLTPEGALVR